MDLLELIKGRYTVRKYKKKPISKKAIGKIIEAGVWASSVIGMQPWRFVVITDRLLNMKISNILIMKAEEVDSVKNLLHTTAKTIANSPMIILVYNRNIIKNIERNIFKIKKEYLKKKHIEIAEKAEIEAISGAIQNMILVADTLGIKSCWNTIPLFCDKEINDLLKAQINHQLVALLTFGFPSETTKRSPRRPLSETVHYITQHNKSMVK